MCVYRLDQWFSTCELRHTSVPQEILWCAVKKIQIVFWISIKATYPLISTKAVKIILPFASSWCCEFGFSALTEIKSKKRERLINIDSEMRACLSVLEPRFDAICLKKQAHPSH